MTNQKRDKDGKFAVGPVSPPPTPLRDDRSVVETEPAGNPADRYNAMARTVKELTSGMVTPEPPLPAEGKKLYWNETRPYGAPKVTVRGGATRIPEVKDILKENGFMWDSRAHAWIGYHYGSELQAIMTQIEENTGADVAERIYDHPAEDTDASLTDLNDVREENTASSRVALSSENSDLPF